MQRTSIRTKLNQLRLSRLNLTEVMAVTYDFFQGILRIDIQENSKNSKY
jgi:hypothetical protein